MIRAVLDTNVWVSASLTPKGISGQIFREWQEGQFETVVSESILEEMEQVFRQQKIREKMTWSAEEVTHFLFSLYEGGIMTPGKVRLRVVKEDPADDKFFAAAMEGEADYIVTGDKQLQKINRYRGIRILSPLKFFERIKGKKRVKR